MAGLVGRWLCRRGHHKVRWASVHFAGHQSCREGRCERCWGDFQQRLSYFGEQIGAPLVDMTPVPCTHGRDGRPVMACMNCAVARSERGLV